MSPTYLCSIKFLNHGTIILYNELLAHPKGLQMGPWVGSYELYVYQDLYCILDYRV